MSARSTGRRARSAPSTELESGVVEPDDVEPSGAGSVKLVGVQYIGRKEVKRDNVAFRPLEWFAGQVHNMTPEQALPYLRYPDVWAIVDAIEGQPAIDADALAVETAQELLEQPLLPNLQVMDRDALAVFGRRQFNETFPASTNAAQMRTRLAALVNSGRGAQL